MDKENLNFFLNKTIQIDLNNFVISLLCSVILSLLIQIFYVKFSSTLSHRMNFSKNFVLLGATTCIIIVIVKNSLALSLGLVGALSIVRFRAAIKEPEELVYLFLVIAVGLGCGAGQIKVIIVGVITSLLIIYIYYLFLSKKKIEHSEIINLGIIIEEDVEHSKITEIIKELKSISNELIFISMSKTDTTTNINLDIRPKEFNEIMKITETIKQKFKKSKTIVARNSNLNL
ncbi:DUF4956 domain-containing protein [Candidatus Pelagibacter sp.]|jgi:hypothetical protein|nr:DUF4956 domain-containing protein [Candidatus Pelagibacter sp.]|tara:strand:+ start:187 stop:879 length:693 start_codon:yes stop_codon:yes gene_type:complete